jgi:diguanylate cyclase (GGDEF)-like protein/PAS domain S-box-containing protein
MLSRFATFVAQIGHAKARNLLIACGLLLGITVATSTLLLLMQLRNDHLANSARELKNLSLTLAEETDRDLQAAEAIQTGLIDQMRQIGIDSPDSLATLASSANFHQTLRDRIANLPLIDAMALLDAHGRMISTSRSMPAPQVDLGDRDYFHALADDTSTTSVIGEPVLNRASPTLTVTFARKLTAADGRFLGIVTSGIQLDHFDKIFSRIALEGESAFGLMRRDGMLLVRYPHVDPNIGRTFTRSEGLDSLLDSLDGGTVRRLSMVDGKYRIIAPHSLPHYPLLIVVTQTVQSILEPWRSEIFMFGGGTLLLELVIAGVVVLGVRHLRAYEQLQAVGAAHAKAEAQLAIAAERERTADALQTQGQRFEMALSNMHQGLCMFDQSGRLLVVNRGLMELFGLSPDSIVPGMAYNDLTAEVVAAGRVTQEDMNEIRERRHELIAFQRRQSFNWELASGTTLTVTHQPMQDGWLTTYEDITERRQAEARMAHMAHHDALTGLPNRLLFREKLEAALALARRGRLLALHCLDLDQFKAVNDTLGHPIGDALLKAVSGRLLNWTRETDTVARLGGDEFAIVQTAIGKPTEATSFAGRIIELLSKPFEVEGHQLVIGTSIGIAFAPQDGLDPDQLLRCTDLALYRAKAEGRGIYRLFHAEMDALMQARRLLELDLRRAAQCGELEVFYQPLIDVHDKIVAGFEALLRWRHPERGIVPPGEFIPLAEEIGLIVPIGEWVLRQACTDAAAWPGTLKVAVNLSPVQFRNRNMLNAVASALSISGLAPGRLELEITETVMLQETEATLATLHGLHKLGVRIAMDDFGTGYSSLSYLRRFPFDRIKIDQSFVRDLGKRNDCRAIVRAVTSLSSELGIETTAEGVETQEQLDTLTGIGCTEVQGYFFSAAVPGPDVPDLLRRLRVMAHVPHGPIASATVLV